MKRSRLFTMCLMLLGLQSVWAGPRSFRQAAAIAEKQAAKLGVTITQQAKARAFSDVSSAAAKSSSAANFSAAASDGEAAAYYVFPYGDNQGFAIVSGDDQMPEIVAYSDKGTLDENNMSDGCRAFLDAYKQTAEAVAQGDEEALSLVAQKRGFMAASEVKHPEVAPLLGDIQWNQLEPYNGMCPYNETKQQRCYAGCVATAIAQVFRYWKYPKELKEDIPAYESFQTATFELYDIPKIEKGYVYDWDNMLPQYSEGNYTEAQAEAVANLMYHCGAALQMMYSTKGSSSLYGLQVPYQARFDITSYSKYFGYDPDLIYFAERGNFTFAEWCKLIDNELEAGRPILYSAVSESLSGHAFVCDGANGDGLYHINWGWSGSGNGYFDITILKNTDGGVASGFNKTARMIIGLMPDNGVKDEPIVADPDYDVAGEPASLEITEGSRSSSSDSFTLHYTPTLTCNKKPSFDPDDVENYPDIYFKKILLNVGVKDAAGNYILLSEPIEHVGVKLCEPDFTIKYVFPVGVTSIYVIYSEDEGKTWHPCYYLSQDEVLRVSATETSLTLAEDNTDFLTTLKTDNEWVAGNRCNFSYTMTNQNAYDYLGKVNIYISNTLVMPEKPRIYDYVDIPAGSSTTHAFSLTSHAAGDYYFWVYDVKHDKMMVNAQKMTVSPDPSTGIQSAPTSSEDSMAEGLQVSTAGKGTLSIRADKSQAVNIYNLAGQTVCSLQLQAGISANVTLPSGIYLVGNKKVMVK